MFISDPVRQFDMVEELLKKRAQSIPSLLYSRDGKRSRLSSSEREAEVFYVEFVHLISLMSQMIT